MTRLNPTLRACAALLLAAAGCARSLPPLDLSALEGAREARFPEVGAWERDDEALVNRIPPGASRDELIEARDGAGVSLAIAPDLSARNVAIEADVSFHDAGAPALVFRVEEDGGIAHGMCAVVVSARGVLLWRLLDDRWSLVSEVRKPVAADAVHVLRVVARGDTIAVSLNGKRLIRTRGRMLRGRGLVGILGRDGPCRFYAVRARALD